jgi:hypothetical protein
MNVDHTYRDPPQLGTIAECSVKHALVDNQMLVDELKAELAKRVVQTTPAIAPTTDFAAPVDMLRRRTTAVVVYLCDNGIAAEVWPQRPGHVLLPIVKRADGEEPRLTWRRMDIDGSRYNAMSPEAIGREFIRFIAQDQNTSA